MDTRIGRIHRETRSMTLLRTDDERASVELLRAAKAGEETRRQRTNVVARTKCLYRMTLPLHAATRRALLINRWEASRFNMRSDGRGYSVINASETFLKNFGGLGELRAHSRWLRSGGACRIVGNQVTGPASSTHTVERIAVEMPGANLKRNRTTMLVERQGGSCFLLFAHEEVANVLNDAYIHQAACGCVAKM